MFVAEVQGQQTCLWCKLFPQWSRILSQFTTQQICSREAKTKFQQCHRSVKKIATKKLNQFLLFLPVTSREQICLVENRFYCSKPGESYIVAYLQRMG